MTDITIIPVENIRDFIGFKIEANTVNIYAPSALRFSDDLKLKRKEIYSFIQTIKLSKTKDYMNPNNVSISFDKDLWDIDSYFWVINDFLKNGLFKIFQKKNIINKNGGKINWKRTLELKPSIVNKNVVYLDYVVTNTSVSDHILTEIYKFCLDIAIKRVGWLLNNSLNIISNIELSKAEMLHIIKKYQSEIFDDYGKKRLNYMIRILMNLNELERNNKIQTYGIYNYYYVFEKMIDKLYSNITDHRKYNPPTYWTISNVAKKNAPLEPDTLHYNKLNDTMYILDSKMYKYGYNQSLKNLPGSSSIQKQIIYGEYIKTKHRIMNVKNAFVLPYNKKNNKFGFHDDLEYLGYASVDWKLSNVTDYQYIIAILIDLNYLIMSYKFHMDEKIFGIIDESLNIIRFGNK